MKDSVVLIAPPAFKRTFRDTRQQPHLGLAVIASHLLSQRIRCTIIDAYTFSISPESVVKQTLEENPVLIGITTTTVDRFGAINLIKQLKAALPDTMIIGGGQHFTYTAKDALECIPELDFVCLGEGEIVIAALFEELLGEKDFSKINGLVYRGEDVIYVNPKKVENAKGRIIKPAWEVIDLSQYNGTLTLTNHTRSIGVISSRGCSNQCVYCANALNRRVCFRDPVCFADEVEELIRIHKFEGINIQDDSFTSSSSQVEDICNEFIQRKLRFKWYCSLRLDEVTRPMLEMMREAGCVGLGFGIESGSAQILKNVKKGTDVGMIQDVVKMVTQIGFENIGMFVITSLPGETPQTFMESQNVLNQIYSQVFENWERQPVLGSLAQIFPGTALEGYAKRSGLLPKDFSWNSPYENEKFDIFGVSKYVPHYEELEFPIEDIKKLVLRNFPDKKIYIC